MKPTKKQQQVLAEVAKLLNTDEMSVLRLMDNGVFPKPEDRLISIRQISLWIGIADRTIYKWIKEDMFPKPLVMSNDITTTSAKRWYFKEVKDWLDGRPRGTGESLQKRMKNK
jgi:predicted DNA-binding transcriptional regulator AlpA